MDLENLTSYDYQLNLTVLDENESSLRPWWWSDAAGWGVLGAFGLFANTSLALALCGARAQMICYPTACGPRACIPRTRSPLTLGLCLADALICTISIPIGVVSARPYWLADLCKLLFFIQAFPVAVSTLSIMAIALDRLTTLQYPRFMSSLHRRSLLILVTFSIWLVSAILTTPILLVGKIRSNTDNGVLSVHIESDNRGKCPEMWISEQLRKVYVFTYLIMVYVIPIMTVTICHFVMRSKLTALSLTARAKQGELPLPIPLLRRPTHVIIVAGVANTHHGKVLKYHNGSSESYSDESMGNLVERYDAVCKKAPRRSGRPMSTETEIRRHHRRKQRDRKHLPCDRRPAPMTSTLRSRRRLANALVSASIVFTGCWLPHVACAMYTEVYGDDAFGTDTQVISALHYTVLLGYAHSAVNPIVHWALNQQVAAAQPQLQPPPLCELFWCVRAPAERSNCPNAPSSTNEAALGPFHPRFVRSVKHKPPPDSSHYLY